MGGAATSRRQQRGENFEGVVGVLPTRRMLLIACRYCEDSLGNLRGQDVRAKIQSIDARDNYSLPREQSETNHWCY